MDIGPILEGVERRQMDVKSIDRGRLGVEDGKRHPFRDMPRNGGRKVVILGCPGFLPRIDVSVRRIEGISEWVGNVLVIYGAPGRVVLLLNPLLCLTPPHLLELEGKCKTITPESNRNIGMGEIGTDSYLNGRKRPSRGEKSQLLQNLLGAPLVARQNQLGCHVHEMVMIWCI
jgi:hypothetical protein